ncbi:MULTISPECIES: MarR family transcriptional regulator [Clostridium]|uniref:MarR family winged helix-turn-helix transcriptional regulator n=1 Tax=Clostridium TaxID=1485 RepID=UPI000174E532|nr:MarR family transcriptional regulator [Clostridium botulinum]ACD51904.1 transcriptional regulator, MarR family [Clostridium botulinum E3 str. Alaska E43]AJF30014.1 MarR family transcriptional regulator [Clostridium botulinum]AJF33077.1 MarR family transcriptional regulator [Clostridium botulinum]MBN1035846.1 MarR family transcriptional regulator [Clostridium botulinum]MBN1049053.1 MarR family transcriptional regulator [Clostridium botulinum]
MEKSNEDNLDNSNGNIFIDPLEVIAKMTTVSELANRINDEFYKQFKLTRIQFRTLYFLHVFMKEGCSLSELSKKLRISKPSASNLIDRMVSSELVTRISNSEDRRSIKILITSKGIKIIEQAINRDKDFRLQILNFLSNEERQTLYKILVKMEKNMTENFL